MAAFNEYSEYYNILYQDKDYPAEAGYIKSLIQEYRPNTSKILEIGSGTGKHAALLHSEGFDITGIEPSIEMLQVAKQFQKSGLAFYEGNMQSFQLNQQFEVAISLFHVVSYLNLNDELLASFKNIYDHLDQHGIFIFDVWYTPAVLSQVPENRIKTMENDDYHVQRSATPTNHWNQNVIDVKYDVKVTNKDSGESKAFSELHTMRHFGIPELALLAQVTGFELIHTEEFLTKAMPGADTWGICFVLRKNQDV